LKDVDLSCQVLHVRNADQGLAELAIRSPLLPDPRPPKAPSPGPTLAHSSGASIFDDGLGSGLAISAALDEFPTIWTDIGFVDVPEDHWMRIPLRSDWESKIKGKARVYPLGLRDREVVEKAFAELESQGRASRTKKLTPFSYPVFVIWKLVNGELKGRMVVDIRGLNLLVIPDVYPMPSQADILASIRGCQYISAIDATVYFHQWRVHPESCHCLTVVSHLGQHTFNCAIIGFRNTPAYTQREMDRILADLPFAKVYMDNIVFAGQTLSEHIGQIRQLFSRFISLNIALKATKAFLGYPSVTLLGHHVDSFGLSTTEERLAAIAKLTFPETLQELETYLGMTGFLCQYIPYYTSIALPL
jgi:hypothetical protein